MERSALYKGQRWRDLRFSFLAQNPECVLCGDVATVVDHFHGHGQGWQERFFRWDCLRALCASCHGKQRDSRASGLLRLEK
jgi:5-methylcytosine-specific restriction endonuclease McrA